MSDLLCAARLMKPGIDIWVLHVLRIEEAYTPPYWEVSAILTVLDSLLHKRPGSYVYSLGFCSNLTSTTERKSDIGQGRSTTSSQRLKPFTKPRALEDE